MRTQTSWHTSPSWDYTGPRLTVRDDLIERRTEQLYAERMADMERVSEAVCHFLDYMDPRPILGADGVTRISPGYKIGAPFLALFLAKDDVEFVAQLRAAVEKHIREEAEIDAQREIG
jgi:hypothetical protein